MGWAEFALAFAVFFASHSVPLRPPVRPALTRMLGEAGFSVAYSCLSLGVLLWLIAAASRAPFVVLWPWSPWQSYVAIVLMLAACLLFSLAVGRPNPLSFGGRNNDRFNPKRPGVVRLFRHPMLAVLAIWSAAHLVANGDLAHAILFGLFGAFALFGGRLVDRRKRRGTEIDWSATVAEVARQPRLSSGWSEHQPVLRLLLGLALWAALLHLHPVVFGVSPLP